MKHFLVIFLLIIISFSAKAQLQLINDSLLIDGHYRTFHYYRPKQKEASIIFVLHGSGGNGLQMVKVSERLHERAQQENMLLVFPEGYKHFWNECRKASTALANTENIDENTFFTKMIAYLKAKYQADDKKAYAIGFSGGGHMAYKLALTMPQQFKAITAIVANLPTDDNMDCGEMKKPVAVMIINGTGDPTNPYKGGMMKSEGVVLGNVRSTEETFNYWAKIDGYNGKPVKEMVPDQDPSDDITIEKYTYSDNTRPDVVLYKVINGQHEFPKGMDAFVTSWEFFKQQMSKN